MNNIKILYFSMQLYEENHIGDFAYVISKDNKNDECGLVSMYTDRFQDRFQRHLDLKHGFKCYKGKARFICEMACFKRLK